MIYSRRKDKCVEIVPNLPVLSTQSCRSPELRLWLYVYWSNSEIIYSLLNWMIQLTARVQKLTDKVKFIVEVQGKVYDLRYSASLITLHHGKIHCTVNGDMLGPTMHWWENRLWLNTIFCITIVQCYQDTIDLNSSKLLTYLLYLDFLYFSLKFKPPQMLQRYFILLILVLIKFGFQVNFDKQHWCWWQCHRVASMTSMKSSAACKPQKSNQMPSMTMKQRWRRFWDFLKLMILV